MYIMHGSKLVMKRTTRMFLNSATARIEMRLRKRDIHLFLVDTLNSSTVMRT